MAKAHRTLLRALVAVLLIAGLSGAAKAGNAGQDATLPGERVDTGAQTPQLAATTYDCRPNAFRCARGYTCRAFNPPLRKGDVGQQEIWYYMCLPAKGGRQCPSGYAKINVQNNGSYTCEPTPRRVVRRCPRGHRLTRIPGQASFRCDPNRGNAVCGSNRGVSMDPTFPSGRAAAYVCRSLP